MTKFYSLFFKLISGLTFLLCLQYAQAQSLLSKKLTVNFSNVPLATVLNEIGKDGGFYFSYNGNVLHRDSLVSVSANYQPVLDILIQLFHKKYEFEERKNYIIIIPVLPRLSLVNADITNENNTYSVSGLVINDATGERLMNASVYEKQQLASALTDEHGYFKLKFKAPNPGSVAVTVSKRLYRDTTIRFLQTVSVGLRNNIAAYNDARDNTKGVERTSIGRLFISTRQMIQSLNIPDFFAKRPFQVSLTPGLSTHGMFSPQVINKFSLNLLGGYTAGVNGLEIGGLFNINKQDTRYLQAAGIFNLVGGTVHGLQIAGVHNFAIDTVKGIQLAGFINKAKGQVSGLQLSALHNETHKLKGVQIGLVNVADTSQGASIGLVNIIRNGFYKVTLSASDAMNTNLALTTGTHAFYSTLLMGANISANNKMYAFGLGIGHDFMLSDRVYISAGYNYRFANIGSWDDRWQQGRLLLNIQLTKNISLMAGPTFNHYMHSGVWHIPGYKNIVNIPDFPERSTSYYPTRNWVGWEAGIAFNSVFKKPLHKRKDTSHSWYLGMAATAGLAWDEPYSAAYGGEIFAQRDLGNNLSAVFTTGYTRYTVQKDDIIYNDIIDKLNAVEYVVSPYQFIPVKVGIRSKLTNKFYIGGDLGETWAKHNEIVNFLENGVKRQVIIPSNTLKSFTYSATAGFDFNNGLDAGFMFEDYPGYSNVKQFAIRLAYKIRLNK